jgi:hypothetical protein
MPPLEELASELERVMTDLNLPAPSRDAVRAMPSEQHWEMVLSHRGSSGSAGVTATVAPAQLLNTIRRSLETGTLGDDTVERVEALKELAINMRSRTMR